MEFAAERNRVTGGLKLSLLRVRAEFEEFRSGFEETRRGVRKGLK